MKNTTIKASWAPPGIVSVDLIGGFDISSNQKVGMNGWNLYPSGGIYGETSIFYKV
jgi:hypothetical protein